MRRIFLLGIVFIFHFFISFVSKGEKPVISSPLTASGTVGTAIFDYTITASHLPTSFDTANLPTGLSFNSATGTISGIPSVAGTFNTIITATNSSGTDTKTLVFTIAMGDQTIIDLSSAETRTYGDVSYMLNASVSSGLTISYTSSNLSVAVISGNMLTIVGHGTTTIIASQAGNLNYNPATSATQTLTINKKDLSVAGTLIDPKTYDGSAITGAITVGSVSGFVGNETLTVTATGVYADANSGNDKIVVINYNLADGSNGGLAANYSLANETQTGSILPKDLTVTGTIIAPKVYDASAVTGAVAVGTVSGFVANETLTATATGLYADANSGNGKTAVINYNLADGTNGGLAANYTLANETQTGNILPKDLTVSGTIIAPKVYDASAVTAAVAVGTISGFVGNEALTITATGVFADANAGNGKTAVINYNLADGTNGGLAANYSLDNETQTGNILPKNLTISGTVIAPKVYDARAITGALTVGTVSGFVGDENLTVTGTGLYVDANAGKDKIATILYALADGTNGGLAKNYNLPGETQTGNILPKELTISGTSVASKIYDGSTASGKLTIGAIAGFVGNETVTASATGLFDNANAGNSKIVTIIYVLFDGNNGGLAANYSLANGTDTGTIAPAHAIITILIDTVKCSGESITFDNTNFKTSGLVLNEKIASVTLSPAGSPANDPIGVGTHEQYIGANDPIALATTSPTMFVAANYTISINRGKLTINKSPRLVLQNDTICSDAIFSFTPRNVNGNDFLPGTTYSWFGPAGTGFSGGAGGTDQGSISGKLSNTSANNMVAATYRILPKTGNCTGDTFTLLVTVKHLPSKPQIVQTPASLQLCQNSHQNFSVSVANTYSATSSVSDVNFQWSTDASLVATSLQTKPKGKNAIVRFPGAGPYNIKVTDSVLEYKGCTSDSAVIIGPLGPTNTTSNLVIYNGRDFVCLNNNVNASIDGYQWGYDSKDLLSNNYTATEAPFVTAQNLTRPVSDTSTRYVWVLTKSGNCFTKSYFNPPHGRQGIVQPAPVSQTASIKIYPNPVSDEAIITWRYLVAADATVVTITDITGRKILTKPIPANLTPGRTVLQLGILPKGIYVVNIRINNKSVAVGKIVRE